MSLLVNRHGIRDNARFAVERANDDNDNDNEDDDDVSMNTDNASKRYARRRASRIQCRTALRDTVPSTLGTGTLTRDDGSGNSLTASTASDAV